MLTDRLLTNIRTAVLGTMFLVFLFAVAIGRAPESAGAAKRPNIVVIQTDDQTAASVHATYRGKGDKRSKLVMPNVVGLLGERGVEFSNYYASIPVCSPSRATLLSGQYAHTSGLPRNNGRLGGAKGFTQSPIFEQNLATALQDRGYQTAHFGRFTNHYGNSTGYEKTEVPPGWDDWATDWTPGNVRRFYGYSLNVNGRVKGPYGKARYLSKRRKDPIGCPSSKRLVCNYHTDEMTKRAVRQIKGSEPGPIYMQVDYQAPHVGADGTLDTEPARRHIGSASETKLPKPPGFNERNIRDKPLVLRRGNTRLSKKEIKGIENRYRRQLESLRAVDEGVGRIVEMLRQTKRLSKTYIFFLSDNGYFLGEHRFGKSKFLPHEPSSNVPLIVRGPKVKEGKISRAIVGNVDIAPTIVDLAGTELGIDPDGRSFASYLKRPQRTGHRSVILESYMLPSPALEKHLKEDGRPGEAAAAGAGAMISGNVPYVNYSALRAGRYKYVRYEGGGRELYDLREDPFEQTDQVSSPRYRKVVEVMDRQLDRRRFCAGAECRKGIKHLPRPEPKKEKPNRPNRPGNGNGNEGGNGGGANP